MHPLFQAQARHPPSLILWGVGLQLTFAFIVLRTPAARAFEGLSDKVNALIGYSQAGSKFVFGDQWAAASRLIFAFQVLPIIIFICSLFAILYYLGVMQVLVNGMAVVMQSVMGASGAESTNVAASIFMGQTEAPLTIRPFLAGSPSRSCSPSWSAAWRTFPARSWRLTY